MSESAEVSLRETASAEAPSGFGVFALSYDHARRIQIKVSLRETASAEAPSGFDQHSPSLTALSGIPV